LTVPQFRAMRYVSRHRGTGLTPLAEHLGMSTSSASALVERLVRSGMVERETDPDERRRIRLEASPAGAEVVARAQLGTRAWLSGELARLDPDERRALASALDLIGRIGAEGDVTVEATK
jgi:DNA-binding MarR family transcriptional regulator